MKTAKSLRDTLEKAFENSWLTERAKESVIASMIEIFDVCMDERNKKFDPVAECFIKAFSIKLGEIEMHKKQRHFGVLCMKAGRVEYFEEIKPIILYLEHFCDSLQSEGFKNDALNMRMMLNKVSKP